MNEWKNESRPWGLSGVHYHYSLWRVGGGRGYCCWSDWRPHLGRTEKGHSNQFIHLSLWCVCMYVGRQQWPSDSDWRPNKVFSLPWMVFSPERERERERMQQFSPPFYFNQQQTFLSLSCTPYHTTPYVRLADRVGRRAEGYDQMLGQSCLMGVQTSRGSAPARESWQRRPSPFALCLPRRDRWWSTCCKAWAFNRQRDKVCVCMCVCVCGRGSTLSFLSCCIYHLMVLYSSLSGTFYVWADIYIYIYISCLPAPLNDGLTFFYKALKHKV